MRNIEKIKPTGIFTNYIFKAIPLAFDESMSYYETLCALLSYLKETVIPAVNNNAEAVLELQGLYTELKNYVDNYFNNLDVQEEINNKLDAMAEDGTLDDIINQQIFSDLNNDIDNIENTMGDLDNLTTVTKTNLVDSINLSNYNQSLYLSPFMVYNTNDNLTGHLQGACINGNVLYQLRQGETETAGKIYKFNYNTQSYVGIIENVPLYHGNDAVWLNNKIYIACTTSNTDKRICVYDEVNGTSSIIEPINDLTSYGVVGVDKLDNNVIIWVLNSTNNNLTNDKFLSLNPNTLTYSEMTVNDPNNILNFVNTSVVRQSFTICNNEIYILLDVPHVLVAGTIADNTITLNKIYNLPFYDGNNQAINELEGVCVIDNSNYPYGSLMLTGRTYQTYRNINNAFGSDTLQTYVVNPKSGSTFLGYSGDGVVQTKENKANPISVNKSATTLKEIGSSSYPYKDLIRGINGVNNLTCNGGGYIYIRDSGTYYLPFLYNVKNIHIYADGSNKPTIYIGEMDCCNITFETVGANSKITIKATDTTNSRIIFYNSNINFIASSNNIEFNDCQIRISGTTLRTRRCIVNNSVHVSSNYVISCDDASTFIDGINSWTVYSGDKYIQCGGSSIVFTGAGSGNVVKIGGAFVGAINNTQP